ncbi:class I SAM-dependent methyltransferase [Microvirga zambiensis]|uniref:class I SAM-dependent methyltransferase n=1 Tax=Microvirga zambiensis TaxID=1402137 RepID=UPI00191F1AF8|nr:class I SAM-dependent methyltransferase [Microvirga zambiensis]
MSQGRGVSGTEGYGEQADSLVEAYESVVFEDLYRPLLTLLPESGKALDIGAGTGRDAAALARRGLQVHAAEPTAALRAHAQRLHPDPNIVWIDDSLPDLARIHAGGERFDLILMTAVWMHLDERERSRALPRIAELLGDGGKIFMTVRKGPVPAGRRMFEVPIDPLVSHAQSLGLDLLQRYEFADMLGRKDVSWTMLAFEKGNRV